jgi:hypothetical protein
MRTRGKPGSRTVDSRSLLSIYIEITRSILEHIDQGIHKKPD